MQLAVAGLEARLGVEIFRRTTRRVQLTDAGRVLAERARLVLTDLDSAESEASGQAVMPTGQLTLTASVTMGRAILAPVVSAFLDAYPRVSARLVLFDRIVNLVDEGIDVGLRVGHLPDSSAISVGVGEVRRQLVASPGYICSDHKKSLIGLLNSLIAPREFPVVWHGNSMSNYRKLRVFPADCDQVWPGN